MTRTLPPARWLLREGSCSGPGQPGSGFECTQGPKIRTPPPRSGPARSTWAGSGYRTGERRSPVRGTPDLMRLATAGARSKAAPPSGPTVPPPLGLGSGALPGR